MYISIILFGICAFSAFIITNATQTNVNLPKCVNSTDNKVKDQSGTSYTLNLTYYPRENLDEQPPLYTLTGNVDLGKNRACNRIETWTVYSHSYEWHWQGPMVGRTHSKYVLNFYREGGYITGDGRFFDGIFYHNQTDFCVQEYRTGRHFIANIGSESNTEWYIRLRVCRLSSGQTEEKRVASCVKKCTAPNDVVDYSTGRSRRLAPNEYEWIPKVCEGSECLYKNDFCRQSYGLGLDTGERIHLCKGNVAKIPFTNDVKLEYGAGKTELMYLSTENQWKRFEHQYCVDGFVSKANEKYENKKSHQVIMICEEHDAGISHLRSNAQTLHASGFNVLLFVLLKTFYLRG